MFLSPAHWGVLEHKDNILANFVAPPSPEPRGRAAVYQTLDGARHCFWASFFSTYFFLLKHQPFYLGLMNTHICVQFLFDVCIPLWSCDHNEGSEHLYRPPVSLCPLVIPTPVLPSLLLRWWWWWFSRFKLCPTLLWPRGLYPAGLLCPWGSPGKNTAVGCHFILQGIFLTQGSNPHLLHWQADSLLLSPWGSPLAR